MLLQEKKDDAKKDEAKKDEAKKDETKKDEVKKDETAATSAPSPGPKTGTQAPPPAGGWLGGLFEMPYAGYVVGFLAIVVIYFIYKGFGKAGEQKS
jgi:hypothetical protein